MSDARHQAARQLMQAFAARTGLGSAQPPRRYLWTDAFALCNLLGLAEATGERRYRELARQLVDQVHYTLGRYRDDDDRSGWLSGLPEHEGAAHPTRAGLRIGKPLPERRPGEAFDARLEWERDGQYFHYLTKWMHALDQAGRALAEPRLHGWARELAAAATRAFVYRRPDHRLESMYWKMSTDLGRPLVTSMGQHDPLDGYITLLQLRRSAAGLPGDGDIADLDRTIDRLASMLEATELTSPDPLAIGGLLHDAYRLAQLTQAGAVPDSGLLDRLLAAALTGLRQYLAGGELQAPAAHRLAFRELGLAIGLQAVQRLWQATEQGRLVLAHPARARLGALQQYHPVGDAIEAFWLQPEQQRGAAWAEHRDINEVMLATRLAPGGLLDLAPTD